MLLERTALSGKPAELARQFPRREVATDADGEANDIRSVPHLLPTIRDVATGPRLWVADRQFGDLTQPRRFADDEDHFVIRYGQNTGFHSDGTRAAIGGADAAGRAIRQEWGWLGAEIQGERRLYVRRVTLALSGGEDVGVVTDLLDEARHPAAECVVARALQRSLGGRVLGRHLFGPDQTAPAPGPMRHAYRPRSPDRSTGPWPSGRGSTSGPGYSPAGGSGARATGPADCAEPRPAGKRGGYPPAGPSRPAEARRLPPPGRRPAPPSDDVRGP